MSTFAPTATESPGALASFGSGTGSRNQGARASGRGGRANAPAGATRSLVGRARASVNRAGNNAATRRRRQALLAEIEAASRRSRGGPRLSNRQIADFTARLRAANRTS